MYKGTIAKIPIGAAGLITDLPDSKTPSSGLLRADNCNYYNGMMEKDFGSRRWNSTVLPAGVVALKDWWPNETTQRVISVCKNGKVYRFTHSNNYAEVTAFGGAPATLNVSNYTTMVAGGSEDAGNNRKLFIFTGNSPVQVISGDGTTRSTISKPAADWTSLNQPFMSIPYRSSMWTFGNRNNPHTIYMSTPADHEDYQDATDSKIFNVWPGEAEKLVGGLVFGGRFFMVKYPKGVYYLVDTDTNINNWYWQKTEETFGLAGPLAVVPVLSDVLVANQYSSLTSVTAVFTFKDVASADLFNILKNKKFALNEIAQDSFNTIQGLYYPKKQTVFFCFRSNAGIQNDRLCLISYRDEKAPKISWSNKDQPNCLALIKDTVKIEKPFYGANDGYIYEMDQPDRWVGTSDTTVRTGYQFMIETPHMDFSEINQLYGDQMKNFDWLEVIFVPEGRWDLSVDIFIDGVFHRTLTYNMESPSQLDSGNIDEIYTSGDAERTIAQEIGGSGRRIAFRCYNSGVGENIGLVGLRVGFQLSGQEQTG